MRYYVVLEPQEGQSYQDILDVARRAEALGFDGLYRSDHYAAVWGRQERGSTDAWATLAGLARDTERISIGTMVTPATFRPAANLAKVVATVSEMAGPGSGGPRVHLGLGTGWLESEHTMFGFPFTDVSTRFRRLEEQAEVLRGLWASGGEPFSFHGEFEHLDEAIFLPAPTPRPRIILGGSGRNKTVRLAATYADELNTPWATPQDVHELRARLDDACEAAGRERIPLTVTAACIVGATDADFWTRAAELHERIGTESLEDWLRERRGTWALGSPEEVADHVGRLAEAGAEGFTFMHLLPWDLPMLDLIMEDVIPRI